jgi:RND family efflux transporter MFP subunit
MMRCCFQSFALLALSLIIAGCHHDDDQKAESRGPMVVHVVKPVLRTIDRDVEQPGFVNAFEQTSLFSKVSGFIEAYNVDIGDEVHQGQTLAEILVPELNAQHDQMVEQVKLDKKLVEQASQLVDVAKKNVQNAEAQEAEAVANVGKYDAEVARWQTEMERFTRMVEEKALDKEILTETQRQLDASLAAKKAAAATVDARKADYLMAQAEEKKAEIDVAAAAARVQVAEAEVRRTKAMLDYTRITAPYDGVVTVRNANKGDYVQAVTGDKSTTNPSAIFVVERTDKLRIFLDIPERFAAYVQKGTKAAVRADALSGVEIPATVTRTSWAIRDKTRTLWTEIDLTKKEYNGLRSGMYVYASVFIHRPDVFALPKQALAVSGNQTYCFVVRDGKAVKTPVDAALSDGQWVEVNKMKIDDPWVKPSGEEQVIVGDLSELIDGQAVQIAPAATAH